MIDDDLPILPDLPPDPDEEKAFAIMKAATELAESYVAMCFAPRSSIHLAKCQDAVREDFRKYLSLAHEDLFKCLEKAEKSNFSTTPPLIITGLKNPPRVR